MKFAVIALLALTTVGFAGTQMGPSATDRSEYDAVSDDGPYSLLPADGLEAYDHVYTFTNDPDMMSEEDARKTGLLLDVLAGDPTDPLLGETPLDRPATSASEIELAGL